MPECRSLLAAVMVISSPSRPRSMVTMAGAVESKQAGVADQRDVGFQFVRRFPAGRG